MSGEAPTPPAGGSGRGGPPVFEKPPQFQPHWWGMMDALPSQVLRPLRDAMDRRRVPAGRRARRDEAAANLCAYTRDLTEWMGSVDAMMQRHGEPFVDKLDAEQADAFHTSLTASERKALAKCQRIRAAIAYAQMTLDWLDVELRYGR